MRRMRKPYPTDLSDAEWAYLEGHLPTPERDGRPRVHSLREILDADCADDDAGDDREVPVGVGFDRHPHARLALHVAEAVFGGTGDHVEVQPPQAQGSRDAEHARTEQRDRKSTRLNSSHQI